MDLFIYSLDKKIFEGTVRSASLPTENGMITVLPGHASLVTNLKSGTVAYTRDETHNEIPIVGGFAYIDQKRVVLLVD